VKPTFPEFVESMTASVAKEPFNHRDWIFETKLDGYRAIAVIDRTVAVVQPPLGESFSAVRQACSPIEYKPRSMLR
jgi:hypothetical protein